MKLERYLLFGLMIAIIIGFFWYDHKVTGLEEQLAKTEGIKPDTVRIEIKIHDTTFVTIADTVVERADTTVRGDTLIVNHWPILIDNTSQPLFDLRVKVDSKTQLFDYAFKYKPLYLTLTFSDKYDLRKGFKVATSPDIGSVSVDWGEYSPLKKTHGIALTAGFGYSTASGNAGVLLISGVTWKKNEVGLILRDGGKDYYYKRTLWSF